MNILAECPICKRKQSLRNKKCRCGENLDKAKKSKRVNYWVSYRMPNMKQRRELVGKKRSDADDALAKRRTQKREGKFFDLSPNITLNELSEWYIELSTVKALASFDRVETSLSHFNEQFGKYKANRIKPANLDEYISGRKEAGISDATVDMEVRVLKTMISRAFDNGKVGGNVLRAFRTVKKRLRRGANARTRVLSFDEYKALLDVAKGHLRAILIVAMNTGMRAGEIRKLQWKHIDRKKGFIRLPADYTKEGRPKNIPINHHVKAVLDELPLPMNPEVFVFLYQGEPITWPQGVKTSLSRICKKVGIAYGRSQPDGITFHDLRRTVKTYMMQAGVDKALRDKILGHSPAGMDIHYIVPSEEALTEAMEKYTRWMDERMEKVGQQMVNRS